MSVQAVKWLGGFFGVNIAGQPAQSSTVDEQAHTPVTAVPDPPARTLLTKWENTLFGSADEGVGVTPSGNQSRNGNGSGAPQERAPPSAPPSNPTNHYVYSDTRQRWEPHPEAPQHIKDDYERTLKELEEAEKPKPASAPPPMPPALMPMTGPPPGYSPNAPGSGRYAAVNFFEGSAAAPPTAMPPRFGSNNNLPTLPALLPQGTSGFPAPPPPLSATPL